MHLLTTFITQVRLCTVTRKILENSETKSVPLKIISDGSTLYSSMSSNCLGVRKHKAKFQVLEGNMRRLGVLDGLEGIKL